MSKNPVKEDAFRFKVLWSLTSEWRTSKEVWELYRKHFPLNIFRRLLHFPATIGKIEKTLRVLCGLRLAERQVIQVQDERGSIILFRISEEGKKLLNLRQKNEH